MGALATRLEARLGRAREALQELADFQLSEQGLSPAERRRLEAYERGTHLMLIQTAQAVSAEHMGLTLQPMEDEGDHTEQDTRPSTEV